MQYSFTRHVGQNWQLYNKQERLKYLERRALEVLDYTGVEVRTNPFGKDRFFMSPIIITKATQDGLKSYLCFLTSKDEVPVTKTEQFLIRLIKLALKNKQRENEKKRLTAAKSLLQK